MTNLAFQQEEARAAMAEGNSSESSDFLKQEPGRFGHCCYPAMGTLQPLPSYKILEVEDQLAPCWKKCFLKLDLPAIRRLRPLVRSLGWKAMHCLNILTSFNWKTKKNIHTSQNLKLFSSSCLDKKNLPCYQAESFKLSWKPFTSLDSVS